MIGDLKLQGQVIITGSSSLYMVNEINEPATGRIIEYKLFPFSLSELAGHTSEIEEEDGMLRTFEFKWSAKRKASVPTLFTTNYPMSSFEVITPEKFWSFVSK